MRKPATLIIIENRISACDTLIDYILDDIPHANQQPILDTLRELRDNFDSDRDSEISELSEAAQ